MGRERGDWSHHEAGAVRLINGYTIEAEFSDRVDKRKAAAPS
jgi:hypothetical protein